jgi:hypothetical protein
MVTNDEWPALPLTGWLASYETLHRWVQIVGKTRLGLAPFENHWWHCAFYVTPVGLSTSSMPYGEPNHRRAIDAEFDFLNHIVTVRTTAGEARCLALENRSVADFYESWLGLLDILDVNVRIYGRPNEIEDATPFAEDHRHSTYDRDAVGRWFRALSQADRALKRFRGRFTGKSSPVHFWWGGFDLACTRFSGRRAPPRSGGIPNLPDYVVRESYSQECMSAGWWPGTAGTQCEEAAFYAYAYPEPRGCAAAAVEPAAAYYHSDMQEWILPYDEVRRSPDPEAQITRFLETTYDAAARLADWTGDRSETRGA